MQPQFCLTDESTGLSQYRAQRLIVEFAVQRHRKYLSLALGTGSYQLHMVSSLALFSEAKLPKSDHYLRA